MFTRLSVLVWQWDRAICQEVRDLSIYAWTDCQGSRLRVENMLLCPVHFNSFVHLVQSCGRRKQLCRVNVWDTSPTRVNGSGMRLEGKTVYTIMYTSEWILKFSWSVFVILPVLLSLNIFQEAYRNRQILTSPESEADREQSERTCHFHLDRKWFYYTSSRTEIFCGESSLLTSLWKSTCRSVAKLG